MNKILELGLDIGHGGKDYLWSVSRSIQGGAAGLLKREKGLGYGHVRIADRFSIHCPYPIWNIDHRFGLEKFFAVKDKNEV